jgi:hypothetical protein
MLDMLEQVTPQDMLDDLNFSWKDENIDWCLIMAYMTQNIFTIPFINQRIKRYQKGPTTNGM